MLIIFLFIEKCTLHVFGLVASVKGEWTRYETHNLFYLFLIAIENIKHTVLYTEGY